MNSNDDFILFLDKQCDPFITLRPTTITFSSIAVALLDNAPYVHMYVDEKNKRIAFKTCENEKGAIQFYVKKDDSKQTLVRIAGKAKIETIMRLASIEDCSNGIRFYGYYDNTFDGLIFNLNEKD